MAVPSSPEPKKMETQKQKRTTNPGVRVIGGRIYDSQNGKTCHQCRQKTMDFTARCKNMKNDKQCTIMFCHKCLINRYGEKAEEMSVLDDWHCPKCRDICNCSVCMKKKGHKPTGIMVHAAKATGFSSVSQLLDVKGPNASQELAVKSKISSPKKPEASTQDHLVSSPKKRGKENTVDETCNANSRSPKSSPDVKKPKKNKQDEPKERTGVLLDGVVCNPKKDNVDSVLRRSPRKSILPHEWKQEKSDNEIAIALRRSPSKSDIAQEVTKKGEKTGYQNCGGPSAVISEAKKEKKTKVPAERKAKKNKFNQDTSICDYVMDIVLPPGTLLTNVAGIDMLPQDAGYAMQFLEFCSVFGEVLKIRKGQPECVLRDIIGGRTRKGKCSSAVLFLIQLLQFMGEEPSDDEDSFTHSLKRFLDETELTPEDIPEGWFDKGCDRYEVLEPSQKLRLLTFLCDETLSTEGIRDWIEEQNLVFVEKGKEAKEALNAAKEKEKLIKRKLQEDVAKAIIAKQGVPLTVSEHDSIVLEIKAESKRVQEEVLDAMGLASKKRQRSDAVRTEPVILDDSGRAFWRLNSLGDTNLLLQDIGAIEQVSPNDKWFSFDAEEMQVVEKYTSSLRLKRRRIDRLAREKMTKKGNVDPAVDSSSNDDSSDPINNS